MASIGRGGSRTAFAALTLPVVLALGCAGSRLDTDSMASYGQIDVPATLDELAASGLRRGDLVVVGTIGGFEAGEVGVDDLPPAFVQSRIEELVRDGRIDIEGEFGPGVTPDTQQVLPLLDRDDIERAFGPGIPTPYLAVTVAVDRVILDDGHLGDANSLVVREWHPMPRPRLETGARYLLFVGRDPEGWYATADPLPGTFRLEEDRVTDLLGKPAPMAGDAAPGAFIAQVADAVARQIRRATETRSAYP